MNFLFKDSNLNTKFNSLLKNNQFLNAYELLINNFEIGEEKEDKNSGIQDLLNNQFLDACDKNKNTYYLNYVHFLSFVSNQPIGDEPKLNKIKSLFENIILHTLVHTKVLEVRHLLFKTILRNKKLREHFGKNILPYLHIPLLRTLEGDDHAYVFKMLMSSSIDADNFDSLRDLNKIDSTLFMQFLNDSTFVSQENQQRVKKFLALDENKREIFIKKLEKFTDFGLMQFDDVLLTCVQTRARKNSLSRSAEYRYDFNPTVLDRSEFSEYLQILKEKSLTLKKEQFPIRERFLLVGGDDGQIGHWLSGDIEITEREVNVLIIDSLGEKVRRQEKDNAIKMVSNVFLGCNIYSSKNQKQYNTYGCSAFALDDARNLFTVERYLGNHKYLFSYLSRASADTKASNVNGAKLKQCHLPLSLERNTQTLKIFERAKPRPEEEQKLPVNKAGKTFADSIKEEKTEIIENKERVMRLSRKLKKIKRYNANFLLSHDEKEINASMEALTLEGFKRRMTNKNALEEKAPAFSIFPKAAEKEEKTPFDVFKQVIEDDSFWRSRNLQPIEAELIDQIKNHLNYYFENDNSENKSIDLDIDNCLGKINSSIRRWLIWRTPEDSGLSLTVLARKFQECNSFEDFVKTTEWQEVFTNWQNYQTSQLRPDNNGY